MVGQHDLGQVNPFPLPPELQQRQQPPVDDEALFNRRVAVIEYLREEGIDPLESGHVLLEQHKRVQLVPGLVLGFASCLAVAVLSLSCAAL